MAKISELVADREKLAKYDELTEWKENFTHEDIYLGSPYMDFGNVLTLTIPDHIKQIIVSALDAEIKELDEE